MKVEPLSLDERKKIQSLLKTGMSCSKISQVINRGKNTVVSELRRSGGNRDTYNAEKAHNEAKIRLEKGYEKSKTTLSKQNFDPYNTLKERIESLEMQIEILHETIKGILNE